MGGEVIGGQGRGWGQTQAGLVAFNFDLGTTFTKLASKTNTRTALQLVVVFLLMRILLKIEMHIKYTKQF